MIIPTISESQHNFLTILKMFTMSCGSSLSLHFSSLLNADQAARQQVHFEAA